MLDFLRQLKEKYQSIKVNGNTSEELYKEEWILDKTINELSWEVSSSKEKQDKRRKILSKLEGKNFSSDNYPYTGYERKLIEFYDSLMKARTEIESIQLNINLERLLALIRIEMRSIDKNARMKNIVHIDHALFKSAVDKCKDQIESGVLLLEELEKLHSKPIA